MRLFMLTRRVCSEPPHHHKHLTVEQSLEYDCAASIPARRRTTRGAPTALEP